MSGKNTNLIESGLCPKCEKMLSKHPQLSIGAGVYNGDGKKLGKHINKKVYKRKTFYQHPFFYTDELESIYTNELEFVDMITNEQAKKNIRNKEKNTRCGIEAHHLICSESVKKERYQKIIYLLGYSINHHKNGVLLPTIMKVACSYKVPLHQGGHDIAFVLDEKKNKKIVVSVFNTDQELKRLNYAGKIREIVDKIMGTINIDDICDIEKRKIMAKDFINEMDRESQNIFIKLRTFQWTISSDGFDYQRGGIGCFDSITLGDKREKLKKKFKLSYNLSDEVQLIQASIYNDKEKLKEIFKTGRCSELHYINPLKEGNFFKERTESYIQPLDKID